MARILFIDDDPLTLETLNKAVQIFGHEAMLASSGGQALVLAAAQPPDLVMVDMMLPDMDGLAVLSLMKQEPALANIPVVMLSASPEVDIAEISQAAGAQAFLNKPVRLQVLMDIIDHYTSG